MVKLLPSVVPKMALTMLFVLHPLHHTNGDVKQSIKTPNKPKSLQLEYQNYLKSKKNNCDKIFGRQFINYASQCEAMNLTHKDRNDCHAEIIDLIDHLIEYCKTQETYKDFLERLW